MRETRLTFPELALVGGTRALLGAGIGLLLADRLAPGERRAVGWALFLVGAATTLPLALEIFGHSELLTNRREGEEPASRAESRFTADVR